MHGEIVEHNFDTTDDKIYIKVYLYSEAGIFVTILVKFSHEIFV